MNKNTRFCTSCKETKTKDLFHPTKLNKPNGICKACGEAKTAARIAYMRLIDDIIDKPVGKGEELLGAIGDGNSVSSHKSTDMFN